MYSLKYNSIYILLSVIVLFFIALPTTTQAIELEVVFEDTPLFNNANFLPGDAVERFVQVTNNSVDTKEVKVETANVNNFDGLGDVVNLRIEENNVILYNDTFTNFFAAGEVSLSMLTTNSATEYSFFATFEPASGDAYQNAVMGFDLIVGFMGEVQGFSDSPAGGGTLDGVGGGGIVSQIEPLQIFNESARNIDTQNGSALIVWNTNFPASSLVVYGLSDGSSYNLNLSQLQFGYPLSTPEDTSNTLVHGMNLVGLSEGEVYSYRVVSREFPGALPTISVEHIFTLSSEGELSGQSFNTGESTEDTIGKVSVSPKPHTQNIITFGSNIALASSGDNKSNDVSNGTLVQAGVDNSGGPQSRGIIPTPDNDVNNIASAYSSNNIYILFTLVLLLVLIGIVFFRHTQRKTELD